ncbi:spore coat protein CotJB [Clostridium polyendosporum]|uniref:Spore coat protein CotJB n=1 Tax=Clostridium polyendosporum TaxID=69208 RepID=A0A919S148_9CLOT|nr:spore coat protein CotJB [Clostridium polyendosporum]GIM29509.1 spore coat protein CotJB [Clostridium polyendosporum]
MSDCTKKKDMLNKIRELEFATVDLNLYLDTHPRCEKALTDYNCITEELIKLKKLYEQKYGPLTHFGYGTSDYPWQWIDEPWPWESGE